MDCGFGNFFNRSFEFSAPLAAAGIALSVITHEQGFGLQINDGASQSPTGDTRNDGESGHGAINGSVHEVFQVNLSRAIGPALRNRSRTMIQQHSIAGFCA